MSASVVILYIQTQICSLSTVYISNSCHFSSLRRAGEMVARDMEEEKRRKRRAASSDAAGRKIANILRHRRHRERDGTFNWRPVYICIHSGAQAVPFLRFSLRLLMFVKASKSTNDKRRQFRSRERVLTFQSDSSPRNKERGASASLFLQPCRRLQIDPDEITKAS